eukprot:11217010-Lingulodinium_polyedra.AAC.1
MPRSSPAQRELATGQMGWNSVSNATPAARASAARGSAPDGTARVMVIFLAQGSLGRERAQRTAAPAAT